MKYQMDIDDDIVSIKFYDENNLYQAQFDIRKDQYHLDDIIYMARFLCIFLRAFKKRSDNE